MTGSDGEPPPVIREALLRSALGDEAWALRHDLVDAVVASGVPSTSSVDTVPAAGTYFYVVQAVDADGHTSANSNQVSASPGVTLPAPPTNLTVTVPKADSARVRQIPVTAE